MAYGDCDGATAARADAGGGEAGLDQEARSVAAVSRRSAVALLRLTLQVLVDGLEPGSADLDEKIGRLVGRGRLAQQIQQALDVLRVVGNNAVHPGQIDVDDEDLVLSLQKLTNLIVERMIEEPRAIDDLYTTLPERARGAIARRDGNVDPPQGT